MEARTMLVELDCLLDTRLGVISHIDPEAATELLFKDYRGREIDDFETLTDGKVSNDAFRAAWEARDVTVLVDARCTALVALLDMFISDLEDQVVNSPEYDRTRLDVNVYPYQLTEEEKDMMITAIMAYAGIQTQVKIVSIPPEHITPKAIRDNWHVVVMYDFDGWFTLHVDALNKLRIPKHTIIAPALYREQPDPEKITVEAMPDKTPFELMEMSVIDRMGLELLEPRLFSLIDITA